MASRDESYVSLRSVFPEGIWPEALLDSDGGSVLDELAFLDGAIHGGPSSLAAFCSLGLVDELVIPLPLLDGSGFVLGAGTIDVEALITGNAWSVHVNAEILKLRFSRALLKPAVQQGAEWVVDPDEDSFVEIELPVSLKFTSDVAFEIQWVGDGSLPIGLPKCFVGDSGIAIEANDIEIHLDGSRDLPSGFGTLNLPTGWTGLLIGKASIDLPPALGKAVPSDLVFEHSAISSGGFSGKISADWPDLAGSVFGLDFALKHLEISFVQNCLTAFAVAGTLQVPFFERPVEVQIGFGLDGNVTIKLTGTDSDGLFTLTKDGVLEIKLDSLGFELHNGVFLAKLSGKLTPLFGDLHWPAFDVRELSIDSKGNVHLDGGWLDLPKNYSLSLYGFNLEITQLGFGKNDDGSKWIGFSGALELIGGVQAGASVEGLRITFDGPNPNPTLSFRGIGVEFAIPGVLYFKGAVSKSETEERFTGDIKLALLALGIEVDGVVVFGKSASGVKYGAIYLSTDLPSGILLPATGAAIYGFAGLFAFHMEPNRKKDEGWYRNADGGPGWYLRPDEGIEDVTKKWAPVAGSLAFGAGVTIGTYADDGYAFAGKFLFAIVFPGPILYLEGRANMLKDRAELAAGGAEPMFKALAVLDFRADTFTLGLDAQYQKDESGSMVDVRGGAEVYFNLKNPGDWHLYLGKDKPLESRIRASILKLFEANGYLMLTGSSLKLGAWVGFSKHWDFGVGSVDLEAWLDSNAAISWNPTHFHGDVEIHGEVGVDVFGFGFHLTADALLSVDTPKPYHIKAELTVSVKAPWPFGNWDVDLTLEWGPDTALPDIPPPVKEISIEHFKATTVWTLPIKTNLTTPPADAPAVPMDARPCISFTRPTHDDCQIGVNAQPVAPEYELITGSTSVRYGVQSVALEKWDGTTWRPVYAKGTSGDRELFGSWAPIPLLPNGASANQKVWLWAKSPFSFAMYSGPKYAAWLKSNAPDYPCAALTAPEAPRRFCCDFENVDPAQRFISPYRWTNHPEISVSWAAPRVGSVEVLDAPVAGFHKALCLHGGAPADKDDSFSLPSIEFSESASDVSVIASVSGTIISFAGISNEALARLPGFTVHNLGLEPVVLVADGIDCRGGLAVQFTAAVSDVHITLLIKSGPTGQTTANVNTFNVDALVFGIPLQSSQEPQQIALPGTIDRIWIVPFLSGGRVVLTAITTAAGVGAWSVGIDGSQSQRFLIGNGSTNIPGSDLSAVVIDPLPGQALCISSICVTLGPSKSRLQELALIKNNLAGSTIHWSEEGAVLEPNAAYRLNVSAKAVSTDSRTVSPSCYAYFRTAGPPALGVLDAPTGAPADFATNNPFRDLTHYVQQTIPPTVPDPGKQPLLPRPVYCAYDVSAQFNEDYVDLMYLLAGRDLGLYLYDTNNQPVRLADGRLITSQSDWGTADAVTLTRWEQEWVDQVSPACVNIKKDETPKKKKLKRAVPGQLLKPDTVYEARLTPLLLHEDWRNSSLGNYWTVADLGLPSKSNWVVQTFGTDKAQLASQSAAVFPPSTLVNSVTTGTILARTGQVPMTDTDPTPLTWKNYCVTVTAAATDGAMGLVFRYSSGQQHYRFILDRLAKKRWLISVIAGVGRLLAEDSFTFKSDQNYTLSVEAIDSQLRAYQDGALVFAVSDSSIGQGAAGLYSSGHAGSRFSHVKVDDYSLTALVAYRFQFTSSLHADFFHHLHSYLDETWTQKSLTAPDLNAAVIPAGDGSLVPVSESEWRAYNNFVTACFGPAARQLPKNVEATQLVSDGKIRALLMESPEPIVWPRTLLKVSVTSGVMPPATVPGSVKMTSAVLGALRPDLESVSLVMRETANVTRNRIEYLALPGVLQPEIGDPILFADEPNRGPRGTLFQQRSTSNSLDWYEIVTEAGSTVNATWSVQSGQITATVTQSGAASDPAAPGSIAFAKTDSAGDIRLAARLHSDTDAIGVVFRYQDQDHQLRFSISRGPRSFRRLIQRSGTNTTVLWEDTADYDPAQPQDVLIEAAGNRVVGSLNNVLLFAVIDKEPLPGKAGCYVNGNQAVTLLDFRLDEIAGPLVLLEPAFQSPQEIAPLDDNLAEWNVANGEATHSPGTPGDGRIALLGREIYDSVRIAFRMTQPAGDPTGAAGIAIRYQNDSSYYLFTVDPQPVSSGGQRIARVLKKSGAALSEIWNAPLASTSSGALDITLWSDGPLLQVFVNGTFLQSWSDALLRTGMAGLYSAAAAQVAFSRVLIASETRNAGAWTISDLISLGPKSAWRKEGGSLHATNIAAAFAVIGQATWTDYRVTAWLRAGATPATGLIFRYQDEQNYYAAELNKGNVVLIKNKAGVSTTLARQAVTGDFTDGAGIAVEAIGPRLKAYWNSKAVIDVIDGDFAAGRTGVFCTAATDLSVKDFEVGIPPLEARALFRDRFALGDLGGWAFPDPTSWKILNGFLAGAAGTADSYASAGAVTWTDTLLQCRVKPPQSGAVGLAFRYTDSASHYRFLLEKLSDGFQLRLEKVATGNITSLWTGDAITSGMQSGKPVELSVCAQGGVLSTYVDGVPACVIGDTELASGAFALYVSAGSQQEFGAARVFASDLLWKDSVLSEPFTSLAPERWEQIDPVSIPNPPSWDIDNASLLHSGPAGAPPLPSGLPRLLVLKGNPFTDFRITATVRFENQQELGIVFAFSDQTSYEVLRLQGGTGRCFFTRHIAGTAVELGTNRRVLRTDKALKLTVERMGNRVRFYVDGALLLERTEEQPVSGRLGLYCTDQSRARFLNLTVSVPLWQNYAFFGVEDEMQAGTRLTVVGSSARAGLPAATSGKIRFAAGLEDDGRVCFRAETTQIRLLSAASKVEHSRLFEPDEFFVPAGVLVLRKQDGTGLLLFPAASGGNAIQTQQRMGGTGFAAAILPELTLPPADPNPAFSPGLCRLQFLFQRNNQIFDPGSLILSEGGDQSAEAVAIEVPLGAAKIIPGDRLRIAQIVDGSNWKTTIVLVNADSTPAPFAVKFHQADGTPLAVPLEGNDTVVLHSDVIPAGGSRKIGTQGQAANLAQGWAEIVTAASITGTAIIGQRLAADAETEAAVALRSDTGKHFLLPFDNTQGFTTAMAVLNPDPADAAVSIIFRDENGQLISNESLTLGANSRQAFSLPIQFPKVVGQRGVAEFTSNNLELMALGLRFNSRNAFTSIEPIAMDSPPAPGLNAGIPQIVDGGGWQTTIILVNTGSIPAPFSLTFRQPDGTPWKLAVTGATGVTGSADVIPVGGSRIVETSGLSADLSQGWGQAVSAGSIAGMTIIRQRLSATRDSECSVPLRLDRIRRFIFPFDNSGGFSTAVALANQDASVSTVVSVTLRDQDGQILGNRTLNLGPLARSAFTLKDEFPETANVQGVAEFSTANVDLSSVALRFNPNGSFICVPTTKK